MDAESAGVPIDELLAHARFVRGLTRSLVSDAHLAEDLEQEAWVAALAKPPQSGVRAWFRAVVRNLAADAFRSRKSRAQRERKAARPEAGPATADLVAKESALREVLDAVLALDPLHREVVLLRFYEDLPPRAIAARLGVPVNTVRSRLIRAVAELRERLDRRHGGRREGWVLAIGGFAGVRTGGVGAGAAAAVTAGVIMGTGAKVAVAAAVALLVAGGWRYSRPEPAGPGPLTVFPSGTQKKAPTPRPGSTQPEPLDEPASSMTTVSPGGKGTGTSMTLSGSIVDPDGKPVPGARLFLRIVDPVTRGFEETAPSTGGDGTFRLAVPSTEFMVRAEADGYLPLDFVTVTGTAGEERTVRLVLPGRSAVVQGRVLDASGTPLEKVLVAAFLDHPLGYQGKGTAVRSDELGRFRLDVFPAGTLTEIYAMDGRHSAWHDFLTVEPGAVKEIDIRMEEGASLAGIVRDAEGNPAGWVTVRVVAFRWAGRVEALTDAGGRYRIDALMASRPLVHADGGDRGRASAHVEMKAGEEARWDPVLSRGTELRGRLVDSAGEPIAGWAVMVRPEGIPFGAIGQDHTDPKGRFVIPNLPEGAVRVLIADGMGKLPSLDLRGVQPGAESREFVVPDEARPTAMMMGRLADTVGRPIADALILVAPVTAADEMWWASGSCKVDPGTGRFEGGPFPPGRYRVQVNSESFGPRDLGSRELAAGKTLDLGAIAFEAPGTADLAFSLEAGEPPIQAQWTLDRRRPDGTWQRLTQDQVKGARVMNLGPGSYRIGVNGNYARGQQREFEIKSGEVTRVEFGIDRAPMRSVRVTGPSTPMAATVLRLRAFDDHGVLQYEANIGRNLEEDFFRAWAFLVAGTYEFVLTPDRGEETRATLEFGETTGLAAGDTPEIRLR